MGISSGVGVGVGGGAADGVGGDGAEEGAEEGAGGGERFDWWRERMSSCRFESCALTVDNSWKRGSMSKVAAGVGAWTGGLVELWLLGKYWEKRPEILGDSMALI